MGRDWVVGVGSADEADNGVKFVIIIIIINVVAAPFLARPGPTQFFFPSGGI